MTKWENLSQKGRRRYTSTNLRNTWRIRFCDEKKEKKKIFRSFLHPDKKLSNACMTRSLLSQQVAVLGRSDRLMMGETGWVLLNALTIPHIENKYICTGQERRAWRWLLCSSSSEQDEKAKLNVVIEKRNCFAMSFFSKMRRYLDR